MKKRLSLWVLCFLSALAPSCGTDGRDHVPDLADSGTSIGRFEIEPEPLGPDRQDSGAFARRLVDTATTQARASLVRHRIRLAPGVSVSGTVRVPLALPSDLFGLEADSRKGSLATANVQVVDRNGQVLQQENATVLWREVRWLTGSPRNPRNRPVEHSLDEAVQKAVDRAVGRLQTGKVLPR